MPLSQLVRLPVLLVRRIAPTSGGRPWMASGAVGWLADNLSKEMTLLELGSGSSTAWYGARVRKVVSVEPHAEWYQQVAESLRGMDNVDLLRVSIESALADLQPMAFDVVIIDHAETPGDLTRLEALAAIGPDVKIVVLDDSDRLSYREADAIMSSWSAQRYLSYRDRPLTPTETTIYTRELNVTGFSRD